MWGLSTSQHLHQMTIIHRRGVSHKRRVPERRRELICSWISCSGRVSPCNCSRTTISPLLWHGSGFNPSSSTDPSSHSVQPQRYTGTSSQQGVALTSCSNNPPPLSSAAGFPHQDSPALRAANSCPERGHCPWPLQAPWLSPGPLQSCALMEGWEWSQRSSAGGDLRCSPHDT